MFSQALYIVRLVEMLGLHLDNQRYQLNLESLITTILRNLIPIVTRNSNHKITLSYNTNPNPNLR